MSGIDPSDARPRTKRAGKSLYRGTLDTLFTGVAVIVPFIITLYVLTVAADVIGDAFQPFLALLEWVGVIEALESTQLLRFLIELNVYSLVVDFLAELIAVAILVAVIFVVGSVGRHRYGVLAIGYVDHAIASIPGVGTVYKSFRRMGDVMLDGGTENFQDIKLIQGLGDGVHVLGFETGIAPEAISDASDHEEMVTVFVPFAPNPVTGGFLMYVPRSQVLDLDMSVDEGVRSILTSGVATDERTRDPAPANLGSTVEVDQLSDLFAGDDGESDAPNETG